MMAEGKLDFDYVIIGSGVAGAIIAKRLLDYDASTSIAVVEAGERVPLKDRRKWWDFVSTAANATKQRSSNVFPGSPNYWDEADIKRNVLQKYSPTGITATDYDPDSIMLYMFEGELFSDGKGPTNDNKKLSSKDIAFIKQLYPL
jgi:choline dehydrogenase-like flavoprotein